MRLLHRWKHKKLNKTHLVHLIKIVNPSHKKITREEKTKELRKSKMNLTIQVLNSRIKLSFLGNKKIPTITVNQEDFSGILIGQIQSYNYPKAEIKGVKEGSKIVTSGADKLHKTHKTPLKTLSTAKFKVSQTILALLITKNPLGLEVRAISPTKNLLLLYLEVTAKF